MSLESKAGDRDLMVDRTYVFKQTGFPNPEDIDRIFKVLTTSDDIYLAFEGKLRLKLRNK